MRNLLRFLIKFHFPMLFIILEMACIVLMVNNSYYQQAMLLNSSNRLTGGIYSSFQDAGQYFNLRKANKNLAKENANLRALLLKKDSTFSRNDSLLFNTTDSLLQYRFIPAKVINNSINKGYNYITLDKGSKDGLKPDMGVICGSGAVGIIVNVSKNFSTALSILNPLTKISGRLKNTKYYGTVLWMEHDYRKANFTEIPFHVTLAKGDSIMTSGYSSVFPQDILIGTISTFSKREGRNFYQIELELSTDFKNLYNVYIVDNLLVEEQKNLEKATENE